MPISRAEVLDAIMALGLTAEDAETELRGREAEALSLVAAASSEGRADALRQGRLLLQSKEIHFVTESCDPEPVDATEEPASMPVILASPPSATATDAKPPLDGIRRRYDAFLDGPKWRAPVALAVVMVTLSVMAFGAWTLLLEGHGHTSQTLAVRATEEVPLPPGPPPEAHIAASPAYDVRYTLNKKRLDGGKTLYVLIDPVDISTPDFKDDIKLLIRDLIGQYGESISVEIHDDPNSLRASYSRFGDKSGVNVPLTSEESSNVALHFVAAFNGNLKTGMYLNTLQFYAAATPDTPFVGQYTEDIDFDAQ